METLYNALQSTTTHSHRAGKTGAPKEPLPPVRPPAQFRVSSGRLRAGSSTVDDIPACKNSLIPARPASSEAAPPQHTRTRT